MKKISPLLGCDPEVFVINKDTGEFVSAHGLIQGTKDRPQVVKDGMVQVDGLALEFGITPAKTKKQWISRIKSVLRTLDAMLPKHLDLHFTPMARFSDEVIANSPPEALLLGCDPDFNAYTMKRNPAPKLSDPNLRSAGGHIHIGFTNGVEPETPEHIMTCSALTISMDEHIGVPSLGWDSNKERRKLYGKAGCFRPKPYGMEYRTTSNQWLCDEGIMEFVYDQTVVAVQAGIEGAKKGIEPKDFFSGATKLDARSVINQGWGRVGEAALKEAMNAAVQ